MRRCKNCERPTRYLDRRCKSCRDLVLPTGDQITAQCETIRKDWSEARRYPPERGVGIKEIAVPSEFRKLS